MRAEEPTVEGRRPPELDDATLLRCRAQDPIAFQAFVVRYERMVFAVLSHMLGRGPHVEDLAQETSLRAYLAFPRFELDVARPSRWLLTIAARLALNERKRRPASSEGAPEPTELANPESESSRLELGRAIERAIAEANKRIQLVADIRAGNVPMPADSQIDPYTARLLALTSASSAFEKDLAQELGPDTAHRIARDEDLGIGCGLEFAP